MELLGGGKGTVKEIGQKEMQASESNAGVEQP